MLPHRSSTAMVQPLWDKWVCVGGLDLFNDDTCHSGHNIRPTQINVPQSCFNYLNKLLKLNYTFQVRGLVKVHCVISDRRIPLVAGIPLCKSRELSRRGYSMSQLFSIHHDISVTLHTPGAYGQWRVFDHNGHKQTAVIGTRYGTWWPLYGRVGSVQLWLSAGISSVALVLVLRNRDLCHVQLHPTWFDPAAGCRIWPVVSNLHSGHLSEDLCHGQGSPSPAGQLFHQKNMCTFVIQQPEEVHDMANKRVLSVFTLNRLQAGHWVRVNYYIVVDWAHVLVIVQSQGDGCSLSSKHDAVVWQSFGQVAAGCLTILEMAVFVGGISTTCAQIVNAMIY